MTATRSVSVVIVTRNRYRELLNTLRQLQLLPQHPPIIVVDNASEDGTASWVARCHPDVELIRLDRNVGAAGRNTGVEHARTPYIAFSDDDSWWSSDALTVAADLFERHHGLGLIAARVMVGADEIADATTAAMAGSPLRPTMDLPGPPVLGFVACGAIVRRTAFLGAGGFPSWGVGGEESSVALALADNGWGLAYVDRVVAHHHPSLARDAAARRCVETRNEFWTAWSRLPVGMAAAETARLLRPALRDATSARAAFAAGKGLRAVLRTRHPVSRAVASDWRRLEQSRHA